MLATIRSSIYELSRYVWNEGNLFPFLVTFLTYSSDLLQLMCKGNFLKFISTEKNVRNLQRKTVDIKQRCCFVSRLRFLNLAEK